MAIIRKHQRTTFTVVDNAVIRDADLTWRATGLLVYLLSLPQGWKVNTRDLARRKTDGETAVRSTMTELETAGYVRRTTIRDDRGQVRTYVDVTEVAGLFATEEIGESPLSELEEGDQPSVDAPISVEPILGEPPHRKEPEEPLREEPPTSLTASGDVSRGTSRPANPAWDALEHVFGYRADGAEAGLWGQIIAKANQTGDPGGEIILRASRLVAQWGPTRLTPGSLKKWWDRFGSALGGASEADAERIRAEMARAKRRQEAAELDRNLETQLPRSPRDPAHLSDRQTIMEADAIVEKEQIR